MNFFNNTLLFRRIAILTSFIIVSLILWNTYVFFQKFKQDERIKMEILGIALKEFSNSDLNSNIALPDKIITTNTSIPLILVDTKGNIESSQNLDPIKSLDSSYLFKIISLILL